MVVWVKSGEVSVSQSPVKETLEQRELEEWLLKVSLEVGSSG